MDASRFEIREQYSVSDNSIARCRLILTLPAFEDDSLAFACSQLEEALAGGDVASVILAENGLADQQFLAYCKKLVPLIQSRDSAAIIAGDTRIAGRAEADGYLIENGLDALKDAVARFSPHKIVGCGNIRERHKSLEAGESNPDFLFFGALDKDIRPEPHKKNLAMADWWSQMVEIPCAVMGGNVIEGAIDVAQCGAEFVVLSKAVFCQDGNPGEMVVKINDLLDKFGPRFDEE